MSTRVQVAFDVADSATALGVLANSAPEIDIIEAGTVLCLSEGLGAVRRLRAAHPNHPILADLRIARAGAKFAELAFAAGATVVTVVGESPPDVVAGAMAVANAHHGQVEVELDHTWSDEDLRRWADLGVSSVIVHRPLGVSADKDHATSRALKRLGHSDLRGLKVVLAGGLDPSNLHHFGQDHVDVIVAGSHVVESSDPAQAVRSLASMAQTVWRSGS